MPPNRRKRSRKKQDATNPLPSEVLQPGPAGLPESDETISEIDDSLRRVQRYQKWIEQSLEVQSAFATAYIESMKILSNDPAGHWTEAALAELAQEERPAPIINHTTATIMTVVGLQRRSREIAKFLPFDPDDAEPVELLEHLYRWHADQLKLKEIDSKVFLSKYAGGLGFWKLFRDTTEDPRGRPGAQYVTPLSVLWDPNWPDVPWDDVEYAIHAEWRTLDRAIDEWPEFEEEIRKLVGNWLRSQQSGSGGTPFDAGSVDGSVLGDTKAPNRFFWDPQTQRVRIAQVWYKRTRTAKVALWRDSTVESDPARVKIIEEEIRGRGDKARRAVQIVRQPVTTVYWAHMLDQIELSHDVTPLANRSKLPLIPAVGYHFWKRPTGAVEYMRDPQRLLNKTSAVIEEIAARAAHSGFLYKSSETATKEAIEEYASGAGVGIPYDVDIPVKIEPPTLPQYLIAQLNRATQDIRFVVNVNDELMGQSAAQTVSGRAIEARQRGGLLTQEIFFDSFATEQSELARFLVEEIRDTLTPEEARRILGALARRNQDEQLMTLLAGTEPDALEQLLSRAFEAKFDVIVTTQPWDPSGKLAALRTLTDLFQLVQPPPDILVKLLRDSGVTPKSIAEEWLARLQTPPPGAVPGAVPGAPAGGPVPPEVAALAGGVPPNGGATS